MFTIFAHENKTPQRKPDKDMTVRLKHLFTSTESDRGGEGGYKNLNIKLTWELKNII